MCPSATFPSVNVSLSYTLSWTKRHTSFRFHRFPLVLFLCQEAVQALTLCSAVLLLIIITTIIIITVVIHSHSSSVTPSHWEPEPNGHLESRRDSERHRHLLGDSVARGHLRSLCRGGLSFSTCASHSGKQPSLTFRTSRGLFETQRGDWFASCSPEKLDGRRDQNHYGDSEEVLNYSRNSFIIL